MFTTVASRAQRARAAIVNFLQTSGLIGPATGLFFKTGTAAGVATEAMRIDSSQNIIFSPGGATAQTFGATGGTNASVQAHTIGAAASALAYVAWTGASIPLHILAKSRGGAVGTRGLVSSGDFLGSFQFNGDDGAHFISAATIACQAEGTPAANVMAGRLLFFTNAGATTATERMRIDSLGNIVCNTAAIGTTATDGFLYIPTCAGAPTGAPTSYTGRVPLVYDTADNKLYIFNTAWKSVTLA